MGDACNTLYDPPRTSARLPLYHQDDIVKRPWGHNVIQGDAAHEIIVMLFMWMGLWQIINHKLFVNQNCLCIINCNEAVTRKIKS